MIKLKNIFPIMLMTASLEAYADPKPYIISGFDDVLRQAENTGIIKASLKILEEDKTFVGMPELYNVISSNESPPRFALVSAISHWFDSRIDSFLKETSYPVHQRFLRDWLTEWSIDEFKIQKIQEIISSKPDRKFIVIFDNSDASVELSDKLKSKFPDQIVSIYLREVVKKDIPVSATYFLTAFDIALNEYKQKRLSEEEVIQIGKAILKEQNIQNIIPSYAICPTSYRSCEVSSEKIQGVYSLVENHIKEKCKKRSK